MPQCGGCLFVVLSGKRKSGKDYVANHLHRHLTEKGMRACVIHLSEPIKRVFSESHVVPLVSLMSSLPDKEQLRREMVAWGEAQRDQDPAVFCRAALATVSADPAPSVIIVADARRHSDLEFFVATAAAEGGAIVHLRVSADDPVRARRGWIHQTGIDDAATECALDTAEFNMCINNNDIPDDSLRNAEQLIEACLSEFDISRGSH